MRTLGLTGNRLTLSEGPFEGLSSLKQLYLDQFAFFLLSLAASRRCCRSPASAAWWSNEFIVAGMDHNRLWLFLPHPLLLVNTAAFALPFNMLDNPAQLRAQRALGRALAGLRRALEDDRGAAAVQRR